MAKSHTKRKPTKPQVKEIIEATEAASLYVGIWAKNETERLLKKEPIIIPTKWGYQVGKHTVKQINQGWDVFDCWGTFVNTFSSKKSAVYWCLLEQVGRILQSQKLLVQDTRLSKYTEDYSHYRHSKQKALQRNDFFAVDLCNARLAKTQSQLEDAKNDLEKTLNSAKYLKGIWEKPL